MVKTDIAQLTGMSMTMACNLKLSTYSHLYGIPVLWGNIMYMEISIMNCKRNDYGSKTSVWLAVVVLITTGLTICLTYDSAPARSAGITFSGFAKTDMYWDTRNTVSVREGQFMLFPMKKETDADGNDINRNTQFNIIAIQTRLRSRITGPDAFGAKTSGLIETAFFGSTEASINTLRLRHAWVHLDWGNTSLLVGQNWHPLFVPQSFPGTVSFSTGAPFQPFSRNPQIRITHTTGNLTGILAALSQRDFSGPGGTASLRNAAIPNLHAQIQGAAGNILGGIGVDFKRLDIDPQQYEPVNSISYFGFLNITVSRVTSKSYLIYGENLQDYTMLGGVAREATGKRIFPYQTLSLWHELTTGFRGDPEKTQYEIGLYTGYSQNRGTTYDDIITIPGFARGADIDHLYRIAPRVQVQSGPVRFSLESDITTASYGSVKSDGTVTDTDSATNIRLLLGAWLFF